MTTTISPLTDLLAHPEFLALRAAICAQPAEDTTRLVLADWLEERGIWIVFWLIID